MPLACRTPTPQNGGVKRLLTRKARLAEQVAARQQKLMRAIGALDPYADADAHEVEERLRRIRHAGHRESVEAHR